MPIVNLDAEWLNELIGKQLPPAEPGETLFGSPALDVSETFRIVAAMRKLPDLLRRVARLERGADGE